jgi:hypothetical protein
MKKLITTLTLLLMFSSPSYAEWERVGEGVNGDTYYIDFDRIRKVDGFVYYWVLTDYLKPNQYGDFSYQDYKQGDCKLFRSKRLSVSVYPQPMGKGTPSTLNEPDKEWDYPSPNSVNEYLLNKVCKR